MNPLVSVVMSVYNSEKYVKEAVESILTQTYNHFEFIIIDDGSTDNSVKIINGFADERIHLFMNNCNLGLKKSLNRGLSIATGAYIVRMDSDDVSFKDRIEKQVRFMERNNEVMLCGGQVELLSYDRKKSLGQIMPYSDGDIRLGMIYHNCFYHPSVILRRQFLIDNKLQYENNYIDDYDFWIRIMQYGKVANMPDVILNYRIHDNNFSKINMESHVKNEVIALRGRYIDTLKMTDVQKDILKESFEGRFDMINSMQKFAEVLLLYAKNVHNEDMDTSANVLLSEIMYGVCMEYVSNGIQIYNNYKKMSDEFQMIDLRERVVLFLKCLSRGHLRKIHIV